MEDGSVQEWRAAVEGELSASVLEAGVTGCRLSCVANRYIENACGYSSNLSDWFFRPRHLQVMNMSPGNGVLLPHEEAARASFPPFNTPDRTYSTIPQDSEQPSWATTPLLLRARVLPLHRPSSTCANLWNSNAQTARYHSCSGPLVGKAVVWSLPRLSHYTGIEGHQWEETGQGTEGLNPRKMSAQNYWQLCFLTVSATARTTQPGQDGAPHLCVPLRLPLTSPSPNC